MKKLLLLGLILSPVLGFAQTTTTSPASSSSSSSRPAAEQKKISLKDFKWEEAAAEGRMVDIHYNRLPLLSEEDRKTVYERTDVFRIVGKKAEQEGGAE